jgi:hypothetical protein
MKSSLSQIFHIFSCPNRRKRRQFELSGKSIPLLFASLGRACGRDEQCGTRAPFAAEENNPRNILNDHLLLEIFSMMIFPSNTIKNSSVIALDYINTAKNLANQFTKGLFTNCGRQCIYGTELETHVSPSIAVSYNM